MKKLFGFLLCVAALVLYVAAAFSLLSVKSLVFSPSGGSPGELLIGAGAVALSVVLALAGAKALKVGRAQFNGAASVHA